MAQRRDEKLLEQIALRLRELRKVRGLSQDAVFEDTGVFVRRIEAGTNNLTISTLSALCDYYEITLEEFFKGLK